MLPVEFGRCESPFGDSTCHEEKLRLDTVRGQNKPVVKVRLSSSENLRIEGVMERLRLGTVWRG